MRWRKPARIALALLLGVAVAATVRGTAGQAQPPLGLRISPARMGAPGRVEAELTITGLQPEPPPTIEWTITVGGQTIRRPPHPLIAPRIPASIDLPAGRVRVGGDVSVAEFTPVPPIDENLQIAVEVTARQGPAAATAKQIALVRLPTVIVPGYLNDLEGSADPAVISGLEQRGFSATGPAPDLFWFSYRSRALSLRTAAAALAAYVRDVVLRESYAARINIVAYSLGGLMARWNIAFESGWDHLVDRLILTGTPNEGSVTSYLYAWYPAATVARTPAARELLPTFPFWRPDDRTPWSVPPDGQNPTLAALNTHPLPEAIRVYALYGSRERTLSGIAGRLPHAVLSYGPGDGVVLQASALGLPVNGGAGVPGLAGHFVATIDLGPQRHLRLLGAAIPKIADLLLDRRTAHRSEPVEHAVAPVGRGAAPARATPGDRGTAGVRLRLP
ncbi:MAG TPA: hypothetical protein VGZ23_06930 [bacterium]|nr:hypothetical protein [bacterium]